MKSSKKTPVTTTTTTTTTTEVHNFTFSLAAVFAGPPCSAASFEVNSEPPHRGTSLGPLVRGAKMQNCLLLLSGIYQETI